ncbi:MAG: capsular biosynthesis protein [Candidatus Cloacimonetes bacterium]|nr:capsular biosynthesis protein [Candidatus Cloacimonadota bacterium]
MIDIHTHLIPNIDDGSQDYGDSLRQLKKMAEGGIKSVYLTSHYFRGHYQYTREEYNRHFDQLSAQVVQAGINLKLIPGFEVFLQPDILTDIKKHSLTMGDSAYVLIESDLNGLPDDFYNNIYPLLRAGYKPILAHAERYVSIMRKPDQTESLSKRNVYIQTNAGSLLGAYGEKVKQTAWKLVNMGWTHFVASDDHVRGEYKAFFEARDAVEEAIDNHAAHLLFHVYPSLIAKNESIPYQYVHIYRPHHYRRRSWLKRLFA